MRWQMFYRISENNSDPRSLPARLRALPGFEPPAGGWARLEARRRSQRRRFVAASGGLALAASVLAAVGLVGLKPQHAAPTVVAAMSPQVAQLITRSQVLERQLASARPQVVVWNGPRAERASQLESQLMAVDSQLNYNGSASHSDSAEKLWRDRVRLMNALVELHQPEAPALQYASYQY